MLDETENNYEDQLKNYIEKNLKIKDYKVLYKENGKIPLFYPSIIKKKMKYILEQQGE